MEPDSLCARGQERLPADVAGGVVPVEARRSQCVESVRMPCGREFDYIAIPPARAVVVAHSITLNMLQHTMAGINLLAAGRQYK